MATLAELVAQREALEAQIKALAAEQRSEAIEKVKAIMQEHGLTIADLGTTAKTKVRAAAPGSKVAVKYRDNDGNTWSGRGLRPRWLTAELAVGKSLESFAV